MQLTSSHRLSRLIFGPLILCCTATLVSAAPPASLKQAAKTSNAVAISRDQAQRATKPAAPLEEQLAQLRATVNALQQQVAALQSAAPASTANADARLQALEQVIQISNGKVKIVSPGKLELRAPTNLDIDAGAALNLKGGIASVQAPTLNASGTIRSPTAIHDSVVSASYTPGVGNIW